MPLVSRKSMFALGVFATTAVVFAGAFLWSGLYDIGADDPHTRPVYAALETLRDRSIATRASAIVVPGLDDPALIRRGAGNYDAMCSQCHLSPGVSPTELSRGLYPAPPDFSQAGPGDPARRFWVIKHGIKASGMPAWGKSMGDDDVWGLVALVQQLPRLDAERYRALVESSEGHVHSGSEGGVGPAEHRHAHLHDADHQQSHDAPADDHALKDATP